MAKRKSTAKQRAWRAKFARLYGGKKKTATRSKSRSRTVSRPTTRRYTMARRRKKSYTHRSGGFGSVKSVAGKVVTGLGAGSLLGGLLGVGAAFLLAGPVGAAGAYFAPQIKQTLGGFMGGSNGNSGFQGY